MDSNGQSKWEFYGLARYFTRDEILSLLYCQMPVDIDLPFHEKVFSQAEIQQNLAQAEMQP